MFVHKNLKGVVFMAKEGKNNYKTKLLLGTVLKVSPLVAGLIVAGNFVIKTVGGDIVSTLTYEDLKDRFTVEQPQKEEVTPIPTVTPEIIIPDEIDVPENSVTVTETLEEETEVLEEEEQLYENFVPNEDKEVISSKLLDMGFEFDVIDFAGLKEINSNVGAWVTIPGTNIDYPIVHGDDNTYYLNHDIYGNETKLGAIYSDSRQNALDTKMSELSDITIIYGHNFSGQRMFNEICNFKSQEYYDNHRFGVIYTPDGYAYEAEFFAGVVIDGSDDSVLYTADFISNDSYDRYFNNIKSNSRFTSDVELEFGDKVVALVTCTYETDNSRFVLYAKLGKQYTYEAQIEETNANESYALEYR